MRIRINLKGKKNLKIPFNYNYVLTSLIYNKISDSEFAEKLHNSNTFKFFTFSQIQFSKKPIIEDGLIAGDGRISFTISSPNTFLIQNLVAGFFAGDEIKLKNNNLKIEKVEILKTPEFMEKSEFITVSPVIIRTKKLINGREKIWDMSPCDDFFRGIENNLIKKYCIYNNLEKTDKKIKASSVMRNVKRKRIAITRESTVTYHRAYMMDIILEGDIDLIKFAYDCGIGEKNSMGFGMIKYLQNP